MRPEFSRSRKRLCGNSGRIIRSGKVSSAHSIIMFQPFPTLIYYPASPNCLPDTLPTLSRRSSPPSIPPSGLKCWAASKYHVPLTFNSCYSSYLLQYSIASARRCG